MIMIPVIAVAFTHILFNFTPSFVVYNYIHCIVLLFHLLQSVYRIIDTLINLCTI